MREIAHFIDGVAATTETSRTGDVFDPSTGQVQARVVQLQLHDPL